MTYYGPDGDLTQEASASGFSQIDHCLADAVLLEKITDLHSRRDVPFASIYVLLLVWSSVSLDTKRHKDANYGNRGQRLCADRILAENYCDVFFADQCTLKTYRQIWTGMRSVSKLRWKVPPGWQVNTESRRTGNGCHEIHWIFYLIETRRDLLDTWKNTEHWAR